MRRRSSRALARASRRPLARVGVRLAAALVAVVLLPSVAGAERSDRTQSIGDLKTKAAQVAAELDALDLKTSQLDELFNARTIELQHLSDQLSATKSEVDAAQASFDASRRTARQYAIDAYVGTTNDGSNPFGTGDPLTDGQRAAYLSALHGNREQIIENVTASRKDLADRQSSLATARTSVDAKRSQISEDKKALSDTIASRQQVLDSIKGDLAAAVQAEQARLAAEAAARAEAQARAEAARAASARRSVAVVAQMQSGDRGASFRIATSSGDPATAVTLTNVTPPPANAPTAVRVAMAQQGKPYVWAAAGPAAFDCSGLMLFAYAQAGISLPHSSGAIRSMTQRISADQLQPGDLVFGGSPVHHVGMFIGNGQMVNALHSGTNVEIDSIYLVGPVSFGRL